MAKLIEPSYEILTDIDRDLFYRTCEKAARECYQSNNKIKEGSAEQLIKNVLIKNGHEAMLEHCPNISVKFTHNRAFTHELVRMRLCSFAQESQRYVKYDNKNMEFILPHWLSKEENKDLTNTFYNNCNIAEDTYKLLRDKGLPAQDARDVLPNSCATRIVCTTNVREWRHIFKLRTDKTAHPEMLRVMRPLLLEFIDKLPILFEDIYHDWEEN